MPILGQRNRVKENISKNQNGYNLLDPFVLTRNEPGEVSGVK